MPSARFRLTAPTLLWACCLHGQSTNPLELLRQPTPPANERFAYGKDPYSSPKCEFRQGPGHFQVAIMIHGGRWSAKLSDLPEAVTSFELLRPIASAPAKVGIASWNIEYRRLGTAGGGWPGTYLDIGRAADVLRELATQNHLDLSHVIAIGD